MTNIIGNYIKPPRCRARANIFLAKQAFFSVFPVYAGLACVRLCLHQRRYVWGEVTFCSRLIMRNSVFSTCILYNGASEISKGRFGVRSEQV